MIIFKGMLFLSLLRILKTSLNELDALIICRNIANILDIF